MTEVLLCIDRFGGFTRIRPIKVDWSIDGKIETGYHLAPFIFSSGIDVRSIIRCLILLTLRLFLLFLLLLGMLRLLLLVLLVYVLSWLVCFVLLRGLACRVSDCPAPRGFSRPSLKDKKHRAEMVKDSFAKGWC